jgi:biotin carboxyl carrier protein
MKSFKFTINGSRYDVDILSFSGNKGEIEVNGTPYIVDIEREEKILKTPTIVRSPIKEPHKEIERKTGGAKTAIKSPLPGIVLSIFVKPGDEVKKNGKLFCLEAMKMENEIKAERDGVIASIKVSPGQAVLQEEVVMEMD